jgi:TRAP-type C4-dicarboxylate transport system permease small subunit
MWLIAGLVGSDVLARNFLGHGFLGVHDLLTIGLTVFFFSTLPASARHDTHVRMDIIYGAARKAFRHAVDGIGVIGALIFFGAIGYGAAMRTGYMYDVGSSTATIGLPLWPLSVFIAVFSAFAALLAIASYAAQTIGAKR